ncbi:MAG: hypothetical protein ACOC33_01005 [bacterium]
MVKQIQKTIEPLDGYLISMTRDTVNGYYVLEVGIPRGWVYKSNDIIECEEINKNDNGVLLKIKPKKEEVVIDDLFEFVNLIIQTNAKIVEKEKEFNDRMEKYKQDLEMQVKSFYDELDTIKEKSFTVFDKSEKNKEKKPQENTTEDTKVNTKKSKVGRPKTKKTSENDEQKENDK